MLDNATVTALASGLLVLVGIAQAGILVAQNRQARIAIISEYWRRWQSCRNQWGRVIFVGREAGEYYQVVDEEALLKLRTLVDHTRPDTPTVWARDSIRAVCDVLGAVSMRILQGQLKVSDAYPVFGTEVLRHSRPLRNLLDSGYEDDYLNVVTSDKHENIRRELQEWLIYHDGVRRRCLILIDLLWAEAVRLEDLAPSDIKSGADAKKKSGEFNRSRVFREALRLKGIRNLFTARRLSRFLRHAEYKSFFNWKGVGRRRLDLMDASWTARLLGDDGYK